MTPDELVQAYREAAIEYGAAIDSKQANAALGRLPGILKSLYAAGAERRILELLDDKSEHVRVWAGFNALALSPDDGLGVLRDLAQGPFGSVRADAAMTLQLWEEGRLELYWWRDDP